LIRNFGLQKDQVRDIHLERNGGNVHFTIISLDARRKAKSISDLVPIIKDLNFMQFYFPVGFWSIPIPV
jgi:hypothetical protein